MYSKSVTEKAVFNKVYLQVLDLVSLNVEFLLFLNVKTKDCNYMVYLTI